MKDLDVTALSLVGGLAQRQVGAYRKPFNLSSFRSPFRSPSFSPFSEAGMALRRAP